MAIKHLSCFVVAIALLGLTACGEESSAPKAPGDVPATQPALNNAASLVQMAAADAVATNATCPVSGDPINPKAQKISYAGKVIGFCCNDCIKAFKADPEKYAAKL